jgi:nucleoid-associated protein YgaU
VSETLAPTPTPAARPAKSGLNADFHGIPVWGWLAIVLVVGGGVYYMQSRSGVKTVAPQPDSLPGPGTVTGAGAGYATAGNMPQTTTAESVRILTNNQWATAAQKWLIQHGYDATDSAAAVQNYVNGEKLSQPQNSLIEAALVAIGPKPEMNDGAAAKVSALRTPKSGNLFGQIAHGIGSLLGLDNPDNPFGQFVNPFLNNIIDHGPIGGVFQSVNDLVGGNVNLSGKAPGVNIPGVGEVNLGGTISGNGIGVNGSLPGGGSVNVGINPNSTNQFQQNYTVVKGDSLTSVSKKVYGNTGGAQKIYTANLNKIPNPEKLTVGVVLQIPTANTNA